MTEPARPYRWRVCLGVRSSGPTVDDITARLGTGTGTSVAGRRWPHVWEADSGLPPDAELEDHLVALARRFHDRVPAVAELARQADCQVALEAVVHLDPRGEDDPVPAMWTPPEVTAFAAACGIGVDIAAYLECGPDRGPEDV
ncbi:DUF4279 domain-containing protein [Saccharothrix variisporea]|uniref:Uncharacterized protein DUF4279 n=1 Tax=Saccharothrix variisporea TaxID=543527 RepID=A0A495XK90_9PSEU|nr:DUF4279 domain-containing protein [Saccharothrix variisporea]RKT74870.1 uncharacterized protein DUF4279 [Saccharothrix variisporea]